MNDVKLVTLRGLGLALSLALPSLAACGGDDTTPAIDAGRSDGSVDRDTGHDDLDGGGGGDAGPSGDVCARQSEETTTDGHHVIVCEEAFATAPLVRPPPDSTTADGAELVYGGITGGQFSGRSGTYMLPSTPTDWLMAEATFGNVRYGYFLYSAQVRSGVVEGLTPAIRIDDRVMQRVLAGKILEGMASPRTVDAGGEVRFAFDSLTVPIRIRLDDAPESTEADRTTGFARYALLGRIENAHVPVSSSAGTCLPPMDALGDANPLFSATGDDDRVTIFRHPDMHGVFDDVFTLDWPDGVTAGNNMGPGLFISTAALMAAEIPSPTDAHNSPHGTPWGGPSADLTVVTSGGEACTP